MNEYADSLSETEAHKKERDGFKLLLEDIDSGLIIVDRDCRVAWSSVPGVERGDIAPKASFQTGYNVLAAVCQSCGKPVFQPTRGSRNSEDILSSDDPAEASHTPQIEEDRAECARKAADAASDLVFVVDRNGRILEANEPAGKRLGMSVQDLVGSDVSGQFPCETIVERVKMFQLSEPTAESVVCQDPESGHDYSVKTYPVVGRMGEVEKVAIIVHDVTSCRRTEGGKRSADTAKHNLDLVASVSHELRAPLTSIIGFSEILLDDKDEPMTSGQRRMLEIITDNSMRLLNLINDYMDFATIDSGALTVTPSRFSLHKVVDNVIQTMTPLVREKNLNLVSSVSENLPEITSDEQKLRQILLNLISNAVKFTENGGITVDALAKGANVHISVKDTGIGIRKSDIERVFEEFQRATTPGVKTEGAGLGLSITKRLVTLLGGDIRAESEIGEGSTFTVEIPVSLGETSLSQKTPVSKSLVQ